MSRRRSNILDQLEDARSTERRSMQVLKNAGLTSGRYIPAMIAGAAATQRLRGNILAQGNRENNAYLGEEANLLNSLGQADRVATMQDLQYYNDAYDRAHAASLLGNYNADREGLKILYNTAAEIRKAKTLNNTFAQYSSDYALKRDALKNGRYIL